MKPKEKEDATSNADPLEDPFVFDKLFITGGSDVELAKSEKPRPPTLSLSLSSLVKTPTPTRISSRTPDVVSSGRTHGAISRKGKRRSECEDRFTALPLASAENGFEPMSIYGVYDGHGGQRAAQFASERIPDLLLKLRPRCEEDALSAMHDAFLRTDKELNDDTRGAGSSRPQSHGGLGRRTRSGSYFASLALQCRTSQVDRQIPPSDFRLCPFQPGEDAPYGAHISSTQADLSPSKVETSSVYQMPSLSRRSSSRAEDHISSVSAIVNPNCGTTATVVLLLGARIIIAQVGDSRAVLMTRGKARRIFEDQRPCRRDELERIVSAGGLILDVGGTERVNGVLAVSRAIGDPGLKEFVVADPEIITKVISEEDDYLVLASDGLWDKVDDQECANFILKARLEEGCTLASTASKLVSLACERGSSDDVTVVVVDLGQYRNLLHPSESKGGSGNELLEEPCEEINLAEFSRTPDDGSSSVKVPDFSTPTPRCRRVGDLDAYPDPTPTPRSRAPRSRDHPPGW